MHTQTHSDPHRLTEEPGSLTLSFLPTPASYLLFLFSPYCPLTTHREGEVQPQTKHGEGETKAEVQSPRESYLLAKAKLRVGRVHRQACGDPPTHQETERHCDADKHTLTHTETHTDTTHIHRHTQTHIHTQTHTGMHRDAHIHSKQKDTHTKTHRCRARSTQAEPCRQRGFEQGQPAPRTQTSQLCSPPRNPLKRQEKFLGY